MNHLCDNCWAPFKGLKEKQAHRCKLKVVVNKDADYIVRQNEPICTMMMKAKEKNDFYDLATLATVTKTAVADVYPFFFPERHSPPILNQFGCNIESYDVLAKAASQAPIKLRKKLLIQFRETIFEINKYIVPRSQYHLK